jgi:hypothetical protein
MSMLDSFARPASGRRFLVPLAIVAGLAATGVQAQPGGANGPQVMGWVPAYGIDASTRALAATPAIGQAMTRLGLQFWNPSADGTGIVFAPVDANCSTGRAAMACSRC